MIQEIATIDLLETVIDKIDDGKIADAKDDLITFKDKLQSEVDELVKTYNEAKDLFKKTIKKHRQTLAYAVDKNGRFANLNHLPEFKKELGNE